MQIWNLIHEKTGLEKELQKLKQKQYDFSGHLRVTKSETNCILSHVTTVECEAKESRRKLEFKQEQVLFVTAEVFCVHVHNFMKGFLCVAFF